MELSPFSLPATVRGMQIHGLSDLAWDTDENMLYALSDRGMIFHFRLRLQGSKILSADPIYVAQLAVPEERAPLPDKRAAEPARIDAEGLTLLRSKNGRRGDTELVVVSERKHRFIRFNAKGEFIRTAAVHPPLDNILNFQGANKGLESVAHHKRFGLITAPELPLKGNPSHLHTIYAGKHQWSFPRYSAEARLKAMFALPNEDLMVLERTKRPSSKTMVGTLRYVSLRNCKKQSVCSTTEKAVLPEGLDNFEGLAHLKGSQFLVVSDQSGKNGHGGTLVLITLR